MDDPVRLTKLPASNIIQETNTSQDSTKELRQKKQIQEGIASAKDSFEAQTSNPLFSADINKGEVKFGDGIQGKTLPSANANLEATYRSGAGQTGKNETDPNAIVQHVLRESYLRNTEDLKSYAEKVKNFNEMKKEMRGYLQDSGLTEAARQVEGLTAGKETNIMEQLLAVMKESIKETSEDKKYYLSLLEKMNKISSSISAQLDTISDASGRLAAKEKDDDDDD